MRGAKGLSAMPSPRVVSGEVYLFNTHNECFPSNLQNPQPAAPHPPASSTQVPRPLTARVAGSFFLRCGSNLCAVGLYPIAKDQPKP
jgi:hypothetical protein